MSQQEIIDFLKKHQGKEFTSHEIAEQIDISLQNVSIALSKLIREPDCIREVDFKKIDWEEQKEKWSFKRYSSRTRIYFYKKGFCIFPFFEIKNLPPLEIKTCFI